MKTARQIAAEALMQVEARGAWSNLALDNLLEKYTLNERDSAFAGALFYGVLERLVTLDACVAGHVSKPLQKLDPAVRTALRMGVYQMLYLDSVPDSAAVNESVELVKRLRKTQASGFVNGALRSFLRGGKTVPIPGGALSADLSVEYSCPQPLVKRWLEDYGEEDARRILAGSLGRPPLYLRVNTLRTGAEELCGFLAARGVEAQADPDLPGCVAVEKAGAVHKLPEFRQGLFHVQDKSSQLCALALEVRPGMAVLDACAAPGGKTFTLAQLMEGRGTIVAADLHPHRVELIEKRAAEMGLTGLSTLAADLSGPVDSPLLAPGRFDRVLCDVPCSGLGVIRRKPEIKYKSLEELEKLPEIQYKILETTAQYCKAGGMLLYSTCTLHRRENDDVARRFLEAHPEFAPAPLPAPLGPSHERTILDDFGADGFYLARFVRKE